MAAHDPVALAEIDLYGELMIAAAATPFERLPADRIDEVLRVGQGSERYYERGEPQSHGQGQAQAKAQTKVQIPSQASAGHES
ncbi:hypothetical protein GXW82_35045 [Streptacidiphilus sp. 4-A2]|nr:hypothetical protein [Streptacidiphilus sp. 4-A2]